MCAELGRPGKFVDASVKTVLWEVSSITLVCVERRLLGTVVDPSCAPALWEVAAVMCTEDELGGNAVDP